MKVLITGAAGFIGSHLVDRSLAEGWEVVGIDAFKPHYPRSAKELNLADAFRSPSFTLIDGDLATADLAPCLAGVEVVFHTAAQPGVRGSWEDGFDEYVVSNVLGTQRLLEAARHVDLRRFVYSSSSSVYGNAAPLPTTEADATQPYSPYGVTKLAAEHLCRAYAANWELPTVALRYFTVYGPRQRPDMAIHRLIQCALSGAPFRLFGSGEQGRDFTYVSDVVAANLAAVEAPLENGAVFNVGGGASTTLNGLIQELDKLLGRPIRIEREDERAGDVRHSCASIDRASELLGWSPAIAREEGLRRQIDWHLRRANMAGTAVPHARPVRGSLSADT